jgi:hypothetical protein
VRRRHLARRPSPRTSSPVAASIQISRSTPFLSVIRKWYASEPGAVSRPDQLDLVSLLLVVDERSVDVGLLDHVLHRLGRHLLGLGLAHELH